MISMKRSCLLLVLQFTFIGMYAQLKWIRVDSLFGPLPPSVHVYKTTDSLGGSPNVAYYLEADLNDKNLQFTTDTTFQRRLKPSDYYLKNNKPVVVVNATFFSFATNQNLNIVVSDGKKLSSNIIRVRGKGKDSTHYFNPHSSAIGINKKRKADIAWIKADSVSTKVLATQQPPRYAITGLKDPNHFKKWKMLTAIGGGPVLLQAGEIKITNEEEFRFAGRAVDDRHPRTAMGYTKDNRFIILVIEGRNPGIAAGATLKQEAIIFKDLGCWEALNLDGGGSSCMLVNGKETIKVSDKEGQRPVPAVFLIHQIKDKN